MKLTLLSMCMLCFVVWTATVSAGVRSEEAERYMTSSGLDELVVSIDEAVNSRLNLSRLKASNIPLTGEQERAIKAAIQKVDGRALVLNYLMADTRPEELQQTLTFLQSPLGQKIRTAERAGSEAGAGSAMQEYALQLTTQPASPERLALIEAIIREAHMDEVILWLLERVFLMLGDIATEVSDDHRAQAFNSEIRTEWSTSAPAIKVQFEQLVLVNTQFLYRDFDDSTLQQYKAFLSTPAGQKYWQISVAVINRYLDRLKAEIALALQHADRN